MTPISNGPPVTSYEIQQMRLTYDENEQYGLNRTSQEMNIGTKLRPF